MPDESIIIFGCRAMTPCDTFPATPLTDFPTLRSSDVTDGAKFRPRPEGQDTSSDTDPARPAGVVRSAVEVPVVVPVLEG